MTISGNRGSKSLFCSLVFALAGSAGLSSGAAAQELDISVGVEIDAREADAAPGTRDVQVAGARVRVSRADARDIAVAGADVSIDVPAGRDVQAAAANLTIAGRLSGDVEALAANIELFADVAGGAEMAAANITVSGAIGQGLEAAGANIVIADTARIAGDVELAAALIDVRGQVGGRIEAVAETFKIDGAVTGDVEIAAETVEFGPGARILGGFTYRGPAALEVPTGVVQGAVTIEESDFTFEGPRNWGDGKIDGAAVGAALGGLALVFAIGGFVSAAIAALLLAALLPRGSAAVIGRGRPEWLLAIVIGIAVAFGAPLVAALLLATVIALPLGLALLAAVPIVWFLGHVYGAMILGDLVFNRKKADLGLGARWGFTLIALFALALVGLAPLVGWFIGLVFAAWGIGAMVLAAGREEDAPTPI